MIDLKDIGGLSKPLTRLIDVIADGLGAVWNLTFSRRIAEAQANARRIAAEGEGDAKIALALADASARVIESETTAPIVSPPVASASGLIISPLEERARQRMLQREVRRVGNLGKIASIALRALPPDSEDSDGPIDPDWSTRFIEGAQDVSVDEMQRLWGEVLAREAGRPGSFALMTVDVLRDLTRQEAELFTKVAPLVFNDRALLQHSDQTGEKWAKRGISYDDLLHLEHARLLSLANSQLQLPLTRGERARLQFGRWLIEGDATTDKGSIPVYLLTRAGHELLKVLPSSPADAEFAEWLASSVRGIANPTVRESA